MLIWFNFFFELFLTSVIVLLSSDVLKVKVHSYRDGSSEHHDYMDMAECTSGIKAPSPSPVNSSDKQVIPWSATTPPREPAKYVFWHFLFPLFICINFSIFEIFIFLFWSKTLPLIFYYYYFKKDHDVTSMYQAQHHHPDSWCSVQHTQGVSRSFF